jgi:ABC-2 type transport system ATP-binding protein
MIAAIDSPEKLKRTIQSVQSVEVALDPVPAHAEDGLYGIATVSEVRKLGDKFRLITEDPPAVIAGVMAYAKREDARVISVNTYGPSLEDVFIKLTGLEVRHHGVKTID